MTALTATPQPATALRPPSMLLEVTGAPNPPATAYTSNFAAGLDGWADAGSATLTGNVAAPVGGTKCLRIQGPAGSLADATAQRALTGLSTTSSYRYRATFQIARGEVKLVARDTASGTVLAATSFVTYGAPSNKTVTLSLDFKPTAAAVTIQIVIHQTSAFSASQADVYGYAISVQPLGAWLGTTVYRTDVNGTDVPVREDVGGQDTAGGTMTLTDWEAALVGPVTYRVVDGNGASVGPVGASHAEARRNLHPNPAARVAGPGWSLSPGPGGAAGVTWQAAGGPAGSPTFVRGTWTTAPTGVGNNGWNNGYAVCKAGQWAQARTWVRSSVAQRVTIYLQYWSDSALIQSTNHPGVVLAPNTWTPIEFVAPNAAPAGTTRVLYLTYTITGASGVAWAPGDTYDGTLAQLEVTDTQPARPGDYFDGSSADAGPVRHGWLGAPDASASIETAEQAGLGVWLQLPATATPSAGAAGAPQAVKVAAVTAYEAAGETTGTMHQVIGRSDKIGNPGPLSTRTGTLELYALDYAEARAVRQLLAGGDVAQLRQPTHPGLDLYLVPSRVDEQPREETTPRRWQVDVEFDEVVAP